MTVPSSGAASASVDIILRPQPPIIHNRQHSVEFIVPISPPSTPPVQPLPSRHRDVSNNSSLSCSCSANSSSAVSSSSSSMIDIAGNLQRMTSCSSSSASSSGLPGATSGGVSGLTVSGIACNCVRTFAGVIAWIAIVMGLIGGLVWLIGATHQPPAPILIMMGKVIVCICTTGLCLTFAYMILRCIYHRFCYNIRRRKKHSDEPDQDEEAEHDDTIKYNTNESKRDIEAAHPYTPPR